MGPSKDSIIFGHGDGPGSPVGSMCCLGVQHQSVTSLRIFLRAHSRSCNALKMTETQKCRVLFKAVSCSNFLEIFLQFLALFLAQRCIEWQPRTHQPIGKGYEWMTCTKPTSLKETPPHCWNFRTLVPPHIFTPNIYQTLGEYQTYPNIKR